MTGRPNSKEEQALALVLAEVNMSTAEMVLTAYRGGISVIRQAVLAGTVNPEGFLACVSQVVDALEPLETAYWEGRPPPDALWDSREVL